MMRSHRRLGASLVAALAVAVAAPAGAQVTLGQIDTFEGDSEEGWLINLLGGGSPPASVIPTSVPGGPSGNYLQLSAVGGGGAGSRLNALNVSRWAGNYVAAGITGIQMDVRNFGATDLYLRLALEDVGAMGPTDISFSAAPVFVAAGSDWTTVVFPILPGSLVTPLGSVTNALTSTDAIRLYHSQAPNVPNPGFPIAPVVATLGVDNVTAIAAVPEPATVALLASGLIAVAAVARRRKGSCTA